ncbi:hypothetical protein TNCV_2869381 [Trichonephila clavipes]|nr:hypothetical protein TNCV_2869381 [Trichonephila clavipes]
MSTMDTDPPTTNDSPCFKLQLVTRRMSTQISEPVATINSFSDLESEEIKDQDKTEEVKTIAVPKPKPPFILKSRITFVLS